MVFSNILPIEKKMTEDNTRYDASVIDEICKELKINYETYVSIIKEYQNQQFA